MGKINKIVLANFLLALFFCALVFAESEGAAFFKKNQPAEAIPLLEQTVQDGTAEPDDYNFLGLSYYQTGDFEKSLAAFEAGLRVAGTNKKLLAYNAGNTAFAMQDFAKAEEYYALAILADENFKEAALNRANTRLRQEDYKGALSDYRLFVSVASETDDVQKVEEVIVLLDRAIRQKAEDARVSAEIEKKLLEEEALRNRQMIEDGELPAEEEALAEMLEQGEKEAVTDELPLPESQPEMAELPPTPTKPSKSVAATEIVDDMPPMMQEQAAPQAESKTPIRRQKLNKGVFALPPYLPEYDVIDTEE